MDDNEYFRVVVLDGDEDVPAEVSDNNEDFKFEMSEEGYPEIKLQSGEELRVVEKIRKEDFTSYHHEVISDMNFSNGNLIFKDPDWESFLLGSGEEKAVFRVCDHNNKVFAIEVIDERHYLNGRFVNGEYF
ncbi:MAG: hypothetical protein Q8930_16905, partial [Bacillota bacterium]|nr:hypothetical protein [Bacillota bacterium]